MGDGPCTTDAQGNTLEQGAAEVSLNASLPTERPIDLVSRIRDFAHETLGHLGFQKAERAEVPANMSFYLNRDIKCAAILVDSLNGVSANGSDCVASAGFISVGSELWPTIYVTAPTRETLSLSQRIDAVPLEIERFLPYSSETAVRESIAHEFAHVYDMVAGTIHAEVLKQACLFDLCQAGRLPNDFSPSTRPEKSLEQACRLLAEIPAYAQQPISEPELFRASAKCVNDIREALQQPEVREQQFQIYSALAEWRTALPLSYDVGGQDALVTAMTIVMRDPEVFFSA